MEHAERELIQRVASENFEVRKLYEQHEQYEERLRTLSKLVYLTPKEAQEERELKQMKLKGVEKMIRLSQLVEHEMAA
jgi:hypothetical protein